jgi:cullin 3
MVIQKDGEKLYQNTKKLLEDRLRTVLMEKIVPKFPEYADSLAECERFLTAFSSAWEDHVIALNMIKDILMYLDRTYLPMRSMPLTYDMGVSVFRECIIKSPEFNMSKYLIKIILKVIQYSRDDQMINKSLLTQSLQILDSLPAVSLIGICRLI